MKDSRAFTPRPKTWIVLGVLHGALFVWILVRGDPSNWWSFYCGFMCGGMLTQAWCERKFLGDGRLVERASPARTSGEVSDATRDRTPGVADPASSRPRTHS